jgi:hypothetical protein
VQDKVKGRRVNRRFDSYMNVIYMNVALATLLFLAGCTCADSHQRGNAFNDGGDSGSDASLTNGGSTGSGSAGSGGSAAGGRTGGGSGGSEFIDTLCGNGIIETDEQCDIGILPATSCEELGLGNGTLSCDMSTCRYDTSACETDGEAATDSGAPPATPGFWKPPVEDPYRINWPDEIGWKDSDEALCSGHQGFLASVSIWSDPRGVFALVKSAEIADTIVHNDGTGWRELFSSSSFPPYVGLTGFPQGPLVVYGDFSCGVMLVENGEVTCSAGVYFVREVFVVNDSLAYAVYDNRVIHYDGANWTQLGEPLDTAEEFLPRDIWANEQTVVIVEQQNVFFYDPDAAGFYRPQGIPAAQYRSVWGFAGDDIWIGTSGGELLHFDGSQWRVVAAVDRSIRGLWGDSGELFLHTGNSFARLEGDRIQILTKWSDDAVDNVYVTRLWGNSATEVFLSILDTTAQSSCGSAYVVWYDGRDFRRF